MNKSYFLVSAFLLFAVGCQQRVVPFGGVDQDINLVLHRKYDYSTARLFLKKALDNGVASNVYRSSNDDGVFVLSSVQALFGQVFKVDLYTLDGELALTGFVRTQRDVPVAIVKLEFHDAIPDVTHGVAAMSWRSRSLVDYRRFVFAPSVVGRLDSGSILVDPIVWNSLNGKLPESNTSVTSNDVSILPLDYAEDSDEFLDRWSPLVSP